MFPATLSTGRRLSSPHFTAAVSGEMRGYAVVVPKKVARLSVTRHRIKRRTLEALRGLTPPKALILFPKASVLTQDFPSIRTELAELLSKIRR